MSDKIYNWGILAPGRIARKFATELLQLGNGRVYAVGSRNAERAREFAEEFGAEKYYDTYEGLVNDPRVDIIYVASPHSLHAEHALLCLNHQKPVLCEKALALNQKEVELMLEAARENSTFLMEAFMVPHQPSYREAKRIIDSGELGKVKRINGWFGFNKSPYDFTHRLYNPALGGGALLDIGLYPVFDILWFLGAPEKVTASADLAPTGVDETVAAQFHYPKGLIATVFASFMSASGVGTDIFCEKGTLRLRRSNAVDQWLEVETFEGGTKRYEWPELQCGLKLEAAEAMRCLAEGRLESPLMPHAMSRLLMKTLDTIRQEAGISYPGRDCF